MIHLDQLQKKLRKTKAGGISRSCKLQSTSKELCVKQYSKYDVDVRILVLVFSYILLFLVLIYVPILVPLSNSIYCMLVILFLSTSS
jgi:hypothetical protein